MPAADGFRGSSGGGRIRWRTFLHVLVFLSLIGMYVHHAVGLGAKDTADARWYIDYALSIADGAPHDTGGADILPLYPLWLAGLMRIDPDIRAYLQCLHGNLPYWRAGKRYAPTRSLDICRPLDNPAFYIQILLGAASTALVWLAGWVASGRPMVAHLGAFFLVYAERWVHYGGNAHVVESLAIPLFAGFSVCLAWLVCTGIGGKPDRTTLRKTIVAVTGGLLLGALALTRPPYSYLLAAVPSAAAVWMLRDRPRRREIAAATAWILAGALVFTGPWLMRNYTERGFVGFTNTYGAFILFQRLDYNDMTWRHWIAAFPVWSGGAGRRLATEWFGKETVRWLVIGNPEKRQRRIQGDHILANVAPEDQLDVVLRHVWADLPKHLAVSVPLAWAGMKQWRGNRIPFGHACWLLVFFSLVRGTRRSRSAMAALALCPFVILAINALVAQNFPRYDFGLLLPLSVGVALPVVQALDGARNMLGRWTRGEERPEPRTTPARDAAHPAPGDRD